jgi:hypothetical protein
MAERVRTLALICITKASIKTVISTVVASWVAISDPLVADPRRMTPAACPPTVAALIRRFGDASGDLLNQAVHRRHPGRGCDSLQAAVEYTTSSIWWVRKKTRVISQMATAVVMDLRGFQGGGWSASRARRRCSRLISGEDVGSEMA